LRRLAAAFELYQSLAIWLLGFISLPFGNKQFEYTDIYVLYRFIIDRAQRAQTDSGQYAILNKKQGIAHGQGNSLESSLI